MAVKKIKAEDFERELYSLDSVPAEKVRIPTFEGRVDEDFTLFKNRFEKAMIENRVAKLDKVDK